MNLDPDPDGRVGHGMVDFEPGKGTLPVVPVEVTLKSRFTWPPIRTGWFWPLRYKFQYFIIIN
jgi:hypothetical protein